MKNFQWNDTFTLDEILQHPDDDRTGFILEVDLQYPDELHHSHNDLPLAPEKRPILVSELSAYSQTQLDRLNIPLKESLPKLVPDLNPKLNYVVHYRNLKYYIEAGLKVSKVHRVLSFEQGAWLSGYINFNTEKRKAAANDFEKDFFKLMNNAVFGKTMENLRNRINFKLVQTAEKAIKNANSPAFEKFTIFQNDLVGIHLRKKKLTLDRPIYTGFTILDISKLHMYKFHYGVIRARYGDKARLLFTDTGKLIPFLYRGKVLKIFILITDSLTYHIETPDLYADFADQTDYYDFSGYPVDHPLYSVINKKVLGKFKDELNSVPIIEFCGLRPKMYSLLTMDGEKKTAKGVCKRVVKRSVLHEHYRDCLLNRSVTVAGMKRIVSRRHELSTVQQYKLCLNPCDDKRYILDDGKFTLAHGHVNIPKSRIAISQNQTEMEVKKKKSERSFILAIH